MCDVVGVAIAQRLHDLDENSSGILLGEVAVGVQAIEQLASFAETGSNRDLLGDKEDILVVLEGLVELDAGGVVD